MAQLIEIKRVAVSPKNFMARVMIAPGGPLTTDQDLVGTTNVYNLLPEVCDHTCLGDAGTTFKDAMGATEIAHLLEHVTIELMARTGIAANITCGRTWAVEDEPRAYDVQFDCPDDVLVASALSSAAWILQWAYSGGGEPKPDVEGIIAGIKSLTEQACEQDGIELKTAEPAEAATVAAASDANDEDEDVVSPEGIQSAGEVAPKVKPAQEAAPEATEVEAEPATDADVATVQDGAPAVAATPETNAQIEDTTTKED